MSGLHSILEALGENLFPYLFQFLLMSLPTGPCLHLHSEPGSLPREVGRPWGPRVPWGLLKALLSAVWVPADGVEGRGERAGPAPGAVPKRLPLLLAAFGHGRRYIRVCFQIPRGPGRELSALGRSLNPDSYFLKIMVSGLSRGVESGRA